MKYELLHRTVSNRIMKAYYSHSDLINKKWEKLIGKEDWCISDRDRFVDKFFKKYIGKCFILIDKLVIGLRYDNYYSNIKPYSVYSDSSNDYEFQYGEPVYKHVKQYLIIQNFRSVNEMHGPGYIEMSCIDYLGNTVNFKISRNTIFTMQFKIISKEQFEEISNIFKDDRDDIPFKVTRFLSSEEMKTNKKLIKETVTVMAKDAKSAANMVKNAIEVEYEYTTVAKVLEKGEING